MTVLYSNDFDLETLGALPSGWTNVRGTFTVQTVGSSSGQCLRTTSSSGADNQLVLYTSASTADGTVSGSFVMGSTQDGVDPAYRYDANGLNGYIWDIGFSGSSVIATLYSYSGGSATAIGATAGGLDIWQAGTVLCWEACFEGNTHELRVWHATSTRPSSPSVSRTSATKTSAGYAGGRWRANGAPVGLDNFALANLSTLPPNEIDDVIATLGVSLRSLNASVTGSTSGLTYAGLGAAALPALSAATSGTTYIPGFNSSVAAALPALTAAATVTHTTMHTGSANASLPTLLASVSGWATIYGEVDAVLPALAAGAVGTFKRLFAWIEKPSAATVWDEVEPA